MQTTSTLYKSILAGQHRFEWKVVVNGSTTYGQDVIVRAIGGSECLPRIIRQTFGENTPSIGNCIASEFTVTLLLASSAIPRMATIEPYYRVVNETQNSEWIHAGVYFIDTRKEDEASGTLSLDCYDAMLKANGAEGKTYADLTNYDEWPISMSSALTEIASIMGVSVDSRTSLGSGEAFVIGYPNDYTMREILSFIAVANGGSFTMTPEGKLLLVPLIGFNSTTIPLGKNMNSLKVASALSAWSKVTIYYGDEEAYEAGSDTGRSIDGDDPWAEQGTANSVLTLISGSSYQPFSADNVLLDPAAEIGDKVSFTKGSSTLYAHIWSCVFVCNEYATATVEAPGEDEVDHEYPYVSSADRKMKRMVKLGQPYYGVTITKTKGIEIKRSDGESEAIFNSDVFAMRAKINGVMKDRLYFDPLRGDFVFDGLLDAEALVADALYAEQGDIAELTVDRLSTSRRIRKYILQDVTDDNFVKIQDQYIQWITGTIVSSTGITTEDDIPLLTESGLVLTEEVGAAATEQARNRFGQGLYWQREPVGHTSDGYPLDENGVQVYATTNVTEWPVVVYKYTELVKEQNAFEMQGQNYIPQSIYGAGDENGNSKGYIYKDESGLLMRYVSSRGKNVDISYSDDGFVDAMHRRLNSLIIDKGSNAIVYTVEGDNHLYSLTYSIDGDTISFTWPDGYTCDINIPDDPGGGGGGGGGSSPAPSSSNPIMDGTASPGVATTYARGDHVHPTDTSRVPTSRTINGQALSGNVTLDADDVGAIPSTAKGVAGGVAELDADGVVPSGQLDLSGTQDSITASGILKGDGAGGISAAVAGTDYQAPLVAGTDYATPAQIPSVPSISTSTPQMDGTGAAGSTGQVSDAGHVHPSDTSKADLGLLAVVEAGSTASRAYAVGDYFCWNGLLYRVKLAINQTEPFTDGTNCEQTTVGTALNYPTKWSVYNLSSITTSVTLSLASGARGTVMLIATNSSLCGFYFVAVNSSGVVSMTPVLSSSAIFTASTNQLVITQSGSANIRILYCEIGLP